jgi:putative NADH-flavin reductase
MRFLPLLAVYALYAIALTVALARAGHRAVPAVPATASATPRRHRVRLLVIGATGGTGRQLVAQALERGHSVTALVRNPSRLSLEHPRLTIVRGDVLDHGAVDRAVQGQDAVLSALGHRQYLRPTKILSEGTANLLRAMEAHGVDRFVCETSLGIGDSAGRMGLYYSLFVVPFILPFYFWDKTRQEQVVAASRCEWVIVRPGALTSGEKRGSCRSGPRVGSYLWTVRISRADVANFMLNQLSDDTYLRGAVGICW